MTLPVELRLAIYRQYLEPLDLLAWEPQNSTRYNDLHIALKHWGYIPFFAVCSEFRTEGLRIVWSERRIWLHITTYVTLARVASGRTLGELDWKWILRWNTYRFEDVRAETLSPLAEEISRQYHRRPLPVSLAPPALIRHVYINIEAFRRAQGIPICTLKILFKYLSKVTREYLPNLDTIVLKTDGGWQTDSAFPTSSILRHETRYDGPYEDVQYGDDGLGEGKKPWVEGLQRSLVSQIQAFPIHANQLCIDGIHDEMLAIIQSAVTVRR